MMNRDGAPFRIGDPDGTGSRLRPFGDLVVHFSKGIARRDDFDCQVGGSGEKGFGPVLPLKSFTSHKCKIRGTHCVRVAGDSEAGFSAANYTEIVNVNMLGEPPARPHNDNAVIESRR